MEKSVQAPDPITMDITKSLGYELYCHSRISSDDYPYAEKFYALHQNSIRCPIYTATAQKV